MKLSPKSIMNNDIGITFGVRPLDINIAKVQYNLIGRLGREVAECGDFNPVIEKFSLKSPRMRVGEVQITCLPSKESETNVGRILKLTVFDRSNPQNNLMSELFSGNKQEIINAVKDKSFFEKIKSVILDFDATLKK